MLLRSHGVTVTVSLANLIAAVPWGMVAVMVSGVTQLSVIVTPGLDEAESGLSDGFILCFI